MTEKLSLAALPVAGKRVLMRVDFNVPLDSEGQISDDTRIMASLDSIKYLLQENASVILMSHLGRPKGKVVPELSLAPCAKHLSKVLDTEVIMADNCVGEEVKQQALALKPGQILVLENLRFHEAETKPEKDPNFAKQLAELADCYVNEAFSACHRSHSSVTEVAKLFPQQSAAGFLLQREIDYLGKHLNDPKRPFYAIIGGAKVSTKIGVLEALSQKVDGLLIGGGMVYTFLKAKGIPIGNSLCEEEEIATAKAVMDACQKNGVELHLPSDTIIAEKFSNDSPTEVVPSMEGIPDGWMGLDIGPQALEECTQWLQQAATILWNGPVGVFEIPQFSHGTLGIARALTQTTATTIVGGGDSIAALRAANAMDRMSHVSTGGGACLEFIQFGRLPGIEALSEEGQLKS